MDVPLDQAFEAAREREHRMTELEGRMTALEKSYSDLKSSVDTGFGDMKKSFRWLLQTAIVGVGTVLVGVITAGIVYLFHWAK
jgi:ABC-type protease/lipase transport system fused ATPase/permease subunit